MNIIELMSDPNARVAFVRSSGTELAPTPTEFSRWAEQVVTPNTPLDIFNPESHGNVVGAFQAAKENGHATDLAIVRDSQNACRIDAFDRREQFDCIVVVVSSTAKAFVKRTTELLQVSVRRCVTTIDAARRMLSVDDDYEQMFGHAPEEVIGRATIPIIHPDDIDRANQSFAEVLRTPGAESRTRLRAQHKNGQWLWLEMTRTNLLHTDDPHIRTVALDISAEMAAHLELERQDALIQQLAKAVAVAVLHVDHEGHVELANDRWADITGVVPTRNLEDFIMAAFDQPAALCEKLRAARDAGTDVSAIVEFSSPILGRRKGRLLQQIIRTTGEVERFSGVLLTLDDVTESLTVSQEVTKLTRIDTATRLLNRQGLQEQIQAMLFETTDYELPLQLLHFDLDDFCTLEEHIGEDAAEAAIHEVAQCLRQAVKPQDLVARVSLNEFVLVLRGIAPQHAEQVAARIQHLLATIARVGSTVGVSAARAGDDYQSLIKRARDNVGITAPTSTEFIDVRHPGVADSRTPQP